MYKNLLIVSIMICFGALSGAQEGISWVDHFDELSPIRWKRIPKDASIAPKDTLSAANRVLVLAPPRGQQYLLSSQKFTRGDMEVVFSARRPKSGQYFYYIGFHANEPWLKSVCWILIHNEVVNFMVRTPKGVKLHRKIGEVKKDCWHRLKIAQSGGSVRVEFDGRGFAFDDPGLISDEPMFAFIGANTQGNNSVPAELKVDYMKVSGGAVPARLSPRKLSVPEAKIAAETGDRLTLENGGSSYGMRLDGGLHWGEIRRNGDLLDDPAVFVPVFAVSIDRQVVYSHELELCRTEKRPDGFSAYFRDKASAVELCLTGKIASGNGIALHLSAVNRSGKSREVQLIFPITASLIAPGEAAHTKYFFPWRSGLLGAVTADFSTEYGGLGWMQLQFAVNEARRKGLMFYPLDTRGSFKGLRMLRQQDGVVKVRHMESVNRADYPAFEMLEKQSGLVLAQYYRSRKLAPGEQTAGCEVRMAAFDGDWKTPLREYASFMHKAMKPVAVPRWFRDTFTWLCAHPPFYYDRESGRYAMAEKLAGAEHAAQLAFWDEYREHPKAAQVSQLERYQPGDFQVNVSRGGDEAFRAEIAKVRKLGTRMTLYIDHRFCWKDTKTALRFGKAWGTMNHLGVYNGYLHGKDLYLMCFYDADKWAGYVSDTCARLVKTLGLDGIYLDELGIAFPCYHPDHEHVKKGEYPTSPQDLGISIARVREAMRQVNPQAALMTEHAGSDYLTQFFDGSWDQTFFKRFDFSERYFDDLRLCIFRFCFPRFKISAWGSSSRHAKRCLFNGIGMDMGGAEDRDEERLYAHAMKENGDAFATFEPEPIVRSAPEKLLVNRFPAPEKVAYTFYNTDQKTLTGGVMEKTPFPGGHFVDVIRDEAVAMNGDGHPVVTLAPESVTLVVCFPKVLTVNKTAAGHYAFAFDRTKGDEVVICEDADDEMFLAPRSRCLTLKNASGTGEYRVRGAQSRKLIFKLKKDGYLVDEVVVGR